MSAPRRVLVVDDETNMRATLAEILQMEGYEVTTADSGEAAVELSAKDPFDVVLMDVRMPGMNGVEAFRVIRRQRSGVRVILMSAFPLAELKRLALCEGAVAFLAKPLNIESVVKLIENVKETAILIVEHEEATAVSLHRAIQEHGYRATVAYSAREALELASQIRYDLVFIDAALPAMNGLQLYLAVRQNHPGVTAIMLTGDEERSRRLAREAVAQTAYTALDKPLDFAAIPALLHRIVSQRISGAVEKPGETPR